MRNELVSSFRFCGEFSVSYTEDGLDEIDMTSQPNEHETAGDLSDLVKKLESGSNKEVNLAHLNVCSLRAKMKVLRCLQLLGRFEILAVTETHLDKSISDSEIVISVMKYIRLDRIGRKGGECVLYYAKH